MAKYRPNPDLTIEAIQWTGSNGQDIENFVDPVGSAFNHGEDADGIWAEVYDYLQKTWVPANLNDFIIIGTKQETYPCEEGVFKHKYILAEDKGANELGLYEGDWAK